MKKILIIDDDSDMRDMLSTMLEKEGYATAGAANGRDGERLLGADQFSLVVTDIVMPEQEGLETIIALRKENPELPVIAVSGGARIQPDSYLRSAQMLGARYTFQKPLDRRDFLFAVRNCLREEE